MNIQPAEIVPSVPVPPGRSCAAGRAWYTADWPAERRNSAWQGRSAVL